MLKNIVSNTLHDCYTPVIVVWLQHTSLSLLCYFDTPVRRNVNVTFLFLFCVYVCLLHNSTLEMQQSTNFF